MKSPSPVARMFTGRGKLMSICVVTSLIIFVLFAILQIDSFGVNQNNPLSLKSTTTSQDFPPQDALILDTSDGTTESTDSTDSTEVTPTKEEDAVKVQTITYSALPKATMANPAGLRKPELGLPPSFQEPSADAFPITDRVAAITETRALTGLIPLLMHYANVLGPEWPILFFTTEETIDFYKHKSPVPPAFARLLSSGHIRMKPIPSTVVFGWSFDVSLYLASKWFWAQLGPAEHLLLFQADAILCSNSPRKVEDYFQWDFVGAPIIPKWGGGMNGGLSYRNVSLSRQVVEKWDIQQDFHNEVPHANVEDQWFWMRMEELGGRMPSEEVARTFAVETMWEDMPLGYHQVTRWHEDRLPEIDRWCPEWKLTTGQGILEKESWVDEVAAVK